MELTNIEEQKSKVCIYINSKSNTESHITQRNRLRDYCKNKGYNYEFWEDINREYGDDFNELIRESCRDKKWSKIIVLYKNDIDTNFNNFLKYVILTAIYNIEIESVNDDPITVRIEDDKNKEFFARKYREGNYKNDFVRFRNKSKPPIGYKTENAGLTINEEEAKIVRYIFEETAKGTSQNKLAEKINKQEFESLNKKFTKESFTSILKNSTYTGKVSYVLTEEDPIIPKEDENSINLKTHIDEQSSDDNIVCFDDEELNEINEYYEEYISRDWSHHSEPLNHRYHHLYVFFNDRNDVFQDDFSEAEDNVETKHELPITIDGICPRIIDDDLFENVTNIMISKSPVTNSEKHYYMLSGENKLVCSCCGSNMCGSTFGSRNKNGEYRRYYYCPKFQKRDGSCSTKNIPADQLEKYVARMIVCNYLQKSTVKYLKTAMTILLDNGSHDSNVLNELKNISRIKNDLDQDSYLYDTYINAFKLYTDYLLNELDKIESLITINNSDKIEYLTNKMIEVLQHSQDGSVIMLLNKVIESVKVSNETVEVNLKLQ